MEQQVHFVTGLPRSGSTLLCNILNQNPLFHATPTSGLIEIILAIRNQWDNVVFFKAAPNPEAKDAIMKGMIPSYFSMIDKPVIFDKNRAWVAYLEMAEFLLGRKVKMLCTVRDIVDIIASFEKLYRKHAHNWQFPQEKNNIFRWQAVEDRAGLWMSAEQPIGVAYNRVRDAFSRGLGDRLHIIEFEDLTRTPEVVMKKVYDFLEEEYFFHDFNNIVQTTFEDDTEHGIPGLHDIRGKVEPVTSNAQAVLGKEVYEKYSDAQFWR